MRLPGSIRLQITAVATIAAAVVLALAAAVILSVQRDQLVEALDRSLEQRADALRADIDSGAPGAFVDNIEGDRFVQLVALDGRVLASSPNVDAMAPAVAPDAADTVTSVSDFALEDDAYRVLVRDIGGDRVLVVGENIDDVNDAIRNLRRTLWTAIPTVVALLGVITWLLVGRTLRPVDRIRAEVNEIRAGSLDRRVRRPATDDEIADLVETMNEMLDRVEEAAGHQTSFVADASHELRTPLARMRTELEVELGQRCDDRSSVLDSVLEEVVGLQALVEDLLHLASADAGGREIRRVPVDLDDIVLREARLLRETSTRHIDTSGVSAAHLVGDPAQLLRVVRNLTDNAARHAAGTVALRLTEEPDGVRLEVADDGPGASESDLARIFDRFTRLDASRTAGSGGTGLGLAIVREIVERHGGRVSVSRGIPAGLVFVVELPVGPAHPTDPDLTGS